jgi:hypothetical protein
MLINQSQMIFGGRKEEEPHSPTSDGILSLAPKNSIVLLNRAADYPFLQNLADLAKEGLASGYKPELCEEGVGGTYFLFDENGEKIAVFKPQDEEPYNLNNPKGYRPRSGSFASCKEGILIGEASVRECAAFVLDHGNFANVPPTDLAFCEHPAFYISKETLDPTIIEINVFNEGKKEIGIPPEIQKA